MHAIEATHERRLATTRGADERRGMIRRNGQIDILQRVVCAIPRVQVGDLYPDSH